MDAKLLAADRALDQAWRGGIGVAMAVTRAQELSDPLRLDVLLEDAKVIVSDRHACSPSEALTRLCFVSWYTKRLLRDIASEVVTFAADQRGVADQSTAPSLPVHALARKQGRPRRQVRSQVREHEVPSIRQGNQPPRLPPCHRATVLSIYRPPPPARP